jgi:cyanophycinase
MVINAGGPPAKTVLETTFSVKLCALCVSVVKKRSKRRLYHRDTESTEFHREAQKAFTEVLERGGVIAGTSAGATIQGSFMVRGDTKGNTLMIGDHTEGLDFIHHVTIDQHHLKRNRVFDLVDVIKTHPDLLGIGLDESTAIVVQKDLFEVIGISYVCIYDIDQINGKSKNPGVPNSPPGPFYFLSKGQKFDLKLRRITR